MVPLVEHEEVKSAREAAARLITQQHKQLCARRMFCRCNTVAYRRSRWSRRSGLALLTAEKNTNQWQKETPASCVHVWCRDLCMLNETDVIRSELVYLRLCECVGLFVCPRVKYLVHPWTYFYWSSQKVRARTSTTGGLLKSLQVSGSTLHYKEMSTSRSFLQIWS